MRSRVGAVLVVSLLVLVALPGAARADHTPLPTQVTLVGSLQSELGCPGDWQPECLDDRAVARRRVARRLPRHVRGAGRRFRVQGRPQRLVGRELRGGRRAGRRQHPADRAGRADHVHVRPRDAPDHRQPAPGPGRRAGRPLAPAGTARLAAGAGGHLPALLRAGRRDDRGGRRDRRGGGDVRPDARDRRRARGLPAPRVVRDVRAARVRARSHCSSPGQVAVAAFDAAGALVDATGVQIPGVLDDVYGGAARRDLGVTWRHGVPRFAVWAPTAKSVHLLIGSGRVPMTRDRDGVWQTAGSRSWKGATYAYEVRVFAPSSGRVETNVVTDPYSVALDHRLDPLRRRRPHRPVAHAGRLGPAAQARRDPGRGRPRLRAARAGLLDRRRDGAGRAPRHVPRVHRRRQRRHGAPARARRRRRHPPAPAAGVRLRHGAREPGRPADPGLRPAVVPARLRGAAGLRRRGPRDRRLQLGLRPLALHDAGGLVRGRPGRGGAHPGVPRDGGRDQPGRPARGDGRRLQPHHRVRPEREVGARPDRPGLLPPAHPDRAAGDVDLLRQHGDRAPDDGEADDRLAGHLGPRVQGGRFPLRPDGSPLQGQHARRAAGAGPADARAGRRRRQGDPALRRGLELRRGRQRRPVRAGHPGQHGRHRHRHVLRPPARRGARRRPVRRGPAHPGLRLGAVHRSQRRAGERGARRPARPPVALPGPDQGGARRQPAVVRVRRPHRRDGDRVRCGLQRPAGRIRRRSVGDGHLRRRPRQRDALRRVAVQAAAAHTDGRPGADEHGVAGDDGVRAGDRVLARRHRPAALEVAGPQLVRLRRLVQPDRLVRHRVDVGLGPAAERGQREQVGVHASAAGRSGARTRRRPTSRPPPRGPTSCSASRRRRRCSGSTAPPTSSAGSGSRWAGPPRRRA